MTLLFGHIVRVNCHLTRAFWHCVKDPALIARQLPTRIVIRLKRKGGTIKFLLGHFYFGTLFWDWEKIRKNKIFWGFPEVLWNHFVMFVQRCRLNLPSCQWLSFQDRTPVLWSRHNVRSRQRPDIINNPAIRPQWPMPPPPCYRHFLNQHSSGATDWKKPK